MTDDTTQTWSDFAVVLRTDILPIYLAHERSFDYPSIHGRMHICRCVLFGEFMCRHYWVETTLRPSIIDVRYAIAFHDAGREGNGPDLWEHASVALCESYLAANSRGVSRSPEEIAALISAKGSPETVEERVVHDADVLDIMRPCCGHGGKDGFWEQALLFLSERDDAGVTDFSMRTRVIDEAWEFIRVTEDHKDALRGSRDYVADILEILAQNRSSCPMLAESLLPICAPNMSLQQTR